MPSLRIAIVALGLVTGAALLSVALADARVSARQVSTAIPTTPPDPTPGPEAAALRAQLEEMRRSEDRMVQTVYFALGAVLLMAGGLIAVNILNGFRTYQHDKEAMRNDLGTTVQSGLAEIREAVATGFQQERVRLSEEQAQFESRVQKQAEARYETFADSFAVFQGQVKNDAYSYINQNMGDVSALLNRIIALQENYSATVDRRLQFLEYNIYESQAESYEKAKLYDFLLSTSLVMLRTGLDLENPWMIHIPLMRIAAALHNKNSITSADRDQIVAMLGEIRETNSAIKEEITRRLAELTGGERSPS